MASCSEHGELVVARTVNDLDSMGKKRRNCVERLDRTLGAARQIENQRIAANRGDAAGENCARSMFKALAAHLFGHSRNHAIGYGLGRFRRGISRAESGAPGRYDEI